MTSVSSTPTKQRSNRWVIVVIGLIVLLGAGIAAFFVFRGFQEGEIEPGETITLATAIPEVPTPAPPVNERSGKAVLNPIGIGLASLFIVLMTTLFRWMFKVPPQLPYTVIKARQSVSALHRILVPTTEEVTSERAVELACRLGETQKAEIVLAHIVEVPFTLSLNAPMPTEEARGQEALRTARFIVEQHGLSVRTRVIPHRYVWSGILHLAKDEMADAIVMSVGGGRPGLAEGMGRTAQEVLKRAECEVILDKA